MDSQRSRKSRSVASESQLSRTSKSQRPPLGERVHSAPLEPRKRDSQGSRQNDDSRNSKAPSRSSQSRRVSASGPVARQVETTRVHHERTSVSIKSSLPDVFQQINLVVLGAQGVGKSTFIGNALELAKPPPTPFSSSKVSRDGIVFRFSLLELSLDEVDYENGRQVSFPTSVNGAPLPSIDGVLCLYDVTDPESIAEFPELIGALSASSLPCVLISCKCDQPRKIDPAFNNKISRSFAGIEAGEVSARAPGSQKRCMLAILNLILAQSRENSRPPSPQGTRPRAATIPNKLPLRSDEDPSKSRSHSRSRSDFPRTKSREQLSRSREALETVEASSDEVDNDDDHEPVNAPREQLSIDTSGSQQPLSRPLEPETPVTPGGLLLNGLVSRSEEFDSENSRTPESLYMANMFRPGTADTSDSQTHHTFLNLDDDSQDESSHVDIKSEMEKPKVQDQLRPEIGVDLAELVDRLLLLPTSKQEKKFVPIFLCLYRAFANPIQLLTAVIDRFENVDTSQSVQLTKVGEQLRYLQVLAHWTATYPGDFGGNSVRAVAISFVQRLSERRVFAAAAKEIKCNVDVLVNDDDAEWAYGSKNVSAGPNSLASTLPSTAVSSPERSKKGASSSFVEAGDEEDEDSSVDIDLNSSPRHSGAPSTTSSLVRTANASSASLINLLNLEHARQKAKQLRPVPRYRLTKVQWHQFMETPDSDFAMEVTHIDWTLYTAIRPREFIRHVTLSTEHKRRSKQPDNINMMVKHFNHLAIFVSGMILLRDKPKHRAKALEKFMAIAWKVRQMNNYNSLGAIVAGITGPEIQRLSQTWELVPEKVRKDFMKLTILMSHNRSHSAYRMAWENSSSQRIPFMPLVRQDLTLAHLGNRTFTGSGTEKINWKKFEIMGEVMLNIQKSQEQPYSFPPREDSSITRLILETKILEESEECADPRDELHKRSEQLEPGAGFGGMGGAPANADSSRKKFDWFRRG